MEVLLFCITVKEPMPYTVFLALSLGVFAVCCGSHTLQYHLTLISAPNPGVPQYTITAYIDGVKYGKYDSDVHHTQVLTPLLSLLTEHLEMQTKHAQELEVIQKHKMKFLMGFLNKTRGNEAFHVYQRTFACELNEDGTINGYEEIAYNGKEVITFDKERVVYVPAMQEALVITQLWNKRYDHAKMNKMYMENECIQHMNLYLPYILTDLERKVLPKVKVLSSETAGGRILHCWVYGFYPRAVEVKWIKNERDEIYSEESAEILPNPDGTYQIRVSVEVTPEEGAIYSCHVDHSSLENPLVFPFEQNHGKLNSMILVGGAVLLVTLVALGICSHRRRT